MSEATLSGLDVMYMYNSSRRQPSEKKARLSLRLPLLAQSRHSCRSPQEASDVALPSPFPPPCRRSPGARPRPGFTGVGAELRCECLVVHQEGEELDS